MFNSFRNFCQKCVLICMPGKIGQNLSNSHWLTPLLVFSPLNDPPFSEKNLSPKDPQFWVAVALSLFLSQKCCFLVQIKKFKNILILRALALEHVTLACGKTNIFVLWLGVIPCLIVWPILLCRNALDRCWVKGINVEIQEWNYSI